MAWKVAATTCRWAWKLLESPENLPAHPTVEQYNCRIFLSLPHHAVANSRRLWPIVGGSVGLQPIRKEETYYPYGDETSQVGQVGDSPFLTFFYILNVFL
jgi:hypothetical protein